MQYFNKKKERTESVAVEGTEKWKTQWKNR